MSEEDQKHKKLANGWAKCHYPQGLFDRVNCREVYIRGFLDGCAEKQRMTDRQKKKPLEPSPNPIYK